MKRGFPRSDAAAARRDTGEKVFSGVVRSIDLERHSALIDCPAVARQSGKAVVAGLPLLRDTLAGPGDTVAFFIDWVKGTQASAPMLRLSSQDGMALMGKFRTGTVGYGFVACEEVKDFFGRDPYVKPDLADTFTTGQTVCFNVTINAQGVPTVSEMAECQPDWQPMPSEILGEVDEALDAEPLPPRLATPASRVIPPRPRPTPSASKSGLAAAVAAFAAAAPTLAPRPRAAPAADAADAVAPCAGNWQWGNSGQPEPQSEGQAQQEPQDESQAEWQGGQSAWNNHGAWNSEGGQGMWKDEPGDQTMWNSQGAQSEAAHPEPQEPGYQALHATPQAASARPAPSHSGLATAALAALAAAAATAPAVAPPHTAPAADAADAVAPSAGNWHWGNSNQPEPQSEGQAQQEPQDESQAQWQGGQSAWNNNGAWNSEGGQGMWKDEPGDQTMWNSQGDQSEGFHAEPQALGYQALHATPQADSARPAPSHSGLATAALAALAAAAAAAPAVAPPHTAPAADAADAVAPSAGNWHWGNSNQPEPQSEGQAQQEPQDESQAEWQGGQSAWNNNGAWNSKGGQGMWKDEQGDQTMWNSQGAQSEVFHPEPQALGYQASVAKPRATGRVVPPRPRPVPAQSESQGAAQGDQGEQSSWNANCQQGNHIDQSMWNATGKQGDHIDQSILWNAKATQGDQDDQSSWNAKAAQGYPDDQSSWNAKATQGYQGDQSSWNSKGEGDQGSWWNSKGDQDWWQRDKASQGSWDWSWGKDTEPEPGSKAWRELRDSDLAGAQKKREAGATCALGVVASYIPEKKCGFIECDSVKASLGQQVFIYGDIMTRGLAGPGDLVAFFLHMSSKGKAQASHPLLRLATGVDGTYALKGTFQAASGLSRACVVCEEIRKFFGCEACVHEALAAQLGPDTVVSFNVILNAEGQPEVHDAVPCGDAWQPQPTVMDQAARGMPHPAAESAPAEAEAPKLGGVPEPALPPKAKKAMPLAFQTGASGKGKGGKGGNGGNKGDLDGAWLVGRVKSYSDVNKYGFIESDAVKAACGGDIFMPAIQFVDKGIRIGDTVQVQVKINQKGKPQANQVLPAT
ncbi:unnamed protein product [Effrenium voratum]|uniref:Uncharacterized protein n=1 Tax=Effrenium voratum TaxID=2562239 RepID=A0AA36J118_9DINO|nr:unnamed protein product [Effrenium voratum]